MSWGLKIILSFVIFAAGVITMVAVSINNDTELVTENYYEKEIRYQNEIDMQKRSLFLKNKIKISAERNEILISTDDRELAENLSGEIYFYRTNDSEKDFTEKIKFNSEGLQIINSANMSRGLWKIKLNLIYNSDSYFTEEKIFLE